MVLVPNDPFQPILKVMVLLIYERRLIGIFTKINLEWKHLSVSNSLAYFGSKSVTKKKINLKLTQDVKVIKLFSLSIYDTADE